MAKDGQQRHDWFVEFEHWLTDEFTAEFGAPPRAAWQVTADEAAWRAFARDDAGHEVGAELPHNYAWFRPWPVARSVVVRLRDQIAEFGESARLTSGAAGSKIRS